MARRKPNPALSGILNEHGQLPREALLGTLAIFTITDEQFSLPELTATWAQHNLPESLLPVPARPHDAFLKATSEVDDYEYRLDANRVAHVLVRDLVSDAEVVVRQLTREIRDNEARKLDYGNVGTATFFRPHNGQGHRFTIRPEKRNLAEGEREAMNALLEEITRKYDRYCNYMDSAKVRMMVRGMLAELRALQIKPSIYFVHASRMDELEKLQDVVNSLGGGCSMQLIPMVDLASQRDIIVEAFRNEAVANLEKVAKEIQRIRGSRKSVTPEAYAKAKADFDEVMATTREYTRLLGSVQSRTEGAEEVARFALEELAKEMLA
jgi:hypothetical protein